MSSTKQKGKSSSKRKSSKASAFSIKEELILLALLAVGLVLFLGNLGFAGSGDFGGNFVSRRLFGLFGIVQYILPFWFMASSVIYFTHKKIGYGIGKIVISFLILLIFCVIFELLHGNAHMGQTAGDYFELGMEKGFSGGMFGGIIADFFYRIFNIITSVVIMIILLIACFVLLTEKSFVQGVGRGSRKVYKAAREDIENRNIEMQQRKEERRLAQQQAAKNRPVTFVHEKNEQRITEESTGPAPNIPAFDPNGGMVKKRKKANGMSEVNYHVPKRADSTKTNDIHEVFADADTLDSSSFMIHREENNMPFEEEEAYEDVPEIRKRSRGTKKTAASKTVKEETIQQDTIAEEIEANSHQKTQGFKSPSLSLLTKNKTKVRESDDYLKQMGIKLQQTLQSFGVNVSVTDISCGPSVTRFELQPEQGVKVSRIVNLADDIKLNLAVSDIRIEAPIPGKAAVGIEVPNRENNPVLLRDLIETPDFAKSSSAITFAVGKDISGKVIIADIARMPHLLIAGATGSGKSVCINTLIMSILYKSEPEKVKLLMIDPKVVELSVYNNIPHMIYPVVTDPKKAAGALNWAVAEMSKRYQMFADMNVRDLKGYNAKVRQLPEDMEDRPVWMPQIIIIVDELADLMMVAKNEVEDAICRLAQLARAAGIHLILATQRPSVDVITGLIKANMPSRVAFAVSSGVDSRTIIDMNGAEKLLGKGDMLFYPTGYPKPVRVQGAFVSDQEVSNVVNFLVKQNQEVVYNNEIEEKMSAVSQTQKDGGSGQEASYGYDELFEKAGRFVIEKDKGSIGMLQRVFRIGFNRAARIMDQLEEAGVVGAEEGTKPRQIIMSTEQFDAFIEESV